MPEETHPVTELLSNDENSGIFFVINKEHINAPIISEFKDHLNDYFNNDHECDPQLIIRRISYDSFLIVIEYYPDNLRRILSERRMTGSTAISFYNKIKDLGMEIIIQ